MLLTSRKKLEENVIFLKKVKSYMYDFSGTNDPVNRLVESLSKLLTSRIPITSVWSVSSNHGRNFMRKQQGQVDNYTLHILQATGRENKGS